MNVLIFGGKCDVSLQIQKSLIRVAFNLKALGSFEVGFGIFFIQVDRNCEILNRLAKIAKNCKDKTSKVKIFGYVILTFFNGFIHIRHGLIEIVPVQMQYRPVVVKCRNMVIAELR